MNIRRLTTSAMLAALSLVLMFLAAVFPTIKLSILAIAGLIPAVIINNYGIRWGFLFYAGVSILAFILAPLKDVALGYICVFGYYPMVKSLIERLNRLWLEWLLKLVFANLVALAAYILLKSLFFSAVEECPLPFLLFLFDLAFVVYDIGFSKLISFFIHRISKHKQS